MLWRITGSACPRRRINGAATSNKGSRFERAHGLLSENLPFVRSRGQTRCEATTLAVLAETTVYLGRPQDGEADALEGAWRARRIDDDALTIYALDVAAVGAADRGVKDLVAGRGLAFEDRGTQDLKGVPGERCPLGYAELYVQDDCVSYGPEDLDDFTICQGKPVTTAAHVAFSAEGREEVDAFFEAAVANGATIRGEPGVWTQYSERYYAAFVNDLHQNNVEAVWHAPDPVVDAPHREGVP